MRYFITILLTFVIILFSGFKKREIYSQSKHPIVIQKNEGFKTPIATLTITSLSNTTQTPGGSLLYKIRLINGLTPIANAIIKINDPIGRVCTWVTTDNMGESLWTLSIPSNTESKIYAIEFFYENLKHFNYVTVASTTKRVPLPSYKINLNPVSSLGNRESNLISRGGFNKEIQTIKKTLSEAVDFGKAVAWDNLSNPANIALTAVALINCIPGNSIPVAGQVLCAASLIAVKKNLLWSTAKITFKKGLEAAEVPIDKKTQLLNFFELATVAVSFAELDISEGIVALESLDALAFEYDFLESLNNHLIYVKGKLTGASLAVQRAGTDQVYMMCIYNRDPLPPAGNPISSNPFKRPELQRK